MQSKEKIALEGNDTDIPTIGNERKSRKFNHRSLRLGESEVLDKYEQECTIPVSRQTGVRITKKDGSHKTFYFGILKELTHIIQHFYKSSIILYLSDNMFYDYLDYFWDYYEKRR
jgi:hypothetical protein